MKKELKILVGPEEIAGYFYHLSRGLNELGYSTDFITFEPLHKYDQRGSIQGGFVIRLIKAINSKKASVTNRSIRIAISIPAELISMAWSCYAILKYDIFIFGFGRSLIRFKNIDMWIIKKLNKKIISNISFGSEARPPYINGKYDYQLIKNPDSIKKVYRDSLKISSTVSRHFKYADYIIGSPMSTAQFATKEFLNYLRFGLIVDYEDKFETVASELENKNKGSIRILHSPSHLRVKGTMQIRKTIKELIKEGYKIDYIELNNVPHVKVIEEINACDFVVDQLYSDTPLTTFATEAAYFGKPTIMAGYDLDGLMSHYNEIEFPAIFICKPSEIRSALITMINDRNLREQIGASAQKFVKSNNSPNAVGRKYEKLINDMVPDNWFIKPENYVNLDGVGIESDVAMNNIQNLINTYGESGLCFGLSEYKLKAIKVIDSKLNKIQD